jgi:antirestriction protein ArdC
MATSQTTPVEPKPEKRDFRKEVTESIVRMLEEGVAPWQKPWDAAGIQTPFNPTTDKPYRGGNAVHLMAVGLQRGYTDPRWMTYRQAAENGWQVRKGERGSQIEFWDFRTETGERNGAGAEASNGAPNDEAKTVKPIHRVYTVFNAQQINGVTKYEPKTRTAFEIAHSGEQILANSGANLAHDQRDRAFYNRSRDSIHLPPKEAFRDAPGYYGTALHELAHWTGHPSRLNRSTLNEAYRFGDVNYAKEELRAEIASLFIAAERGIPHDPTNHAAYVDSWAKALKADKHEIFRAAQDASKAADYVLSLEHDKAIQSDQSRQSRPAEHARESSDQVARLERDSATVNVHHKSSGTDRRQSVSRSTDQPGNPERQNPRPSSDELARSFDAAKQVVSEQMGPDTKTMVAATESGTYRGKIIGLTDHHTIQKISPRSAVAHMTHLLDAPLATNDNVAIAYSNSKAAVKPIQERSKTHALAR